jgi:hypothetical protein
VGKSTIVDCNLLGMTNHVVVRAHMRKTSCSDTQWVIDRGTPSVFTPGERFPVLPI